MKLRDSIDSFRIRPGAGMVVMRPQSYAPSVMVRAGTVDETREVFDVGARYGK